MKKIYKLIISLSLPFLAAVIGSIFTISSVSTWYINLSKPIFNPPSWIFGPVWSILYLLMGISLYLLWTKKYERSSFLLFGIQLLLNVLWSILFFGLKAPLYAFVEIIFLWIAIFITIMSFHRINRTSAYLLIPYIVWVSFAAVLNFAIVMLN